MNVEEAVEQACATVGIKPPRARGYGKWLVTDTLSGRNGKGDGRLIINDGHATAWNWQTGETATVWLKESLDPAERKQIARQIEREKGRKVEDAARAARLATRLVDAARLATHPYLEAKGFRDERILVLDAGDAAAIGGDYLVPDDGRRAIVMPARIGVGVSSLQLIWEQGAKKFLYGGEIAGGSHRIARGAETWLCEGLATGLSLRLALKGFGRSATILCCFSASNIVAVARNVTGRCFVAADNDKPLSQYSGVGAGEFFARRAGKPYVMPPTVGDDFNDMHMREGIFVVQRFIADFLREAKM